MLNIFLFTAAVLIWGSTWYAIKLQLGVVPIEWSLVYRFAAATLILFAFSVIAKRKIRFPLTQHFYFFGMGILLFGLNYYLSYLGTSYLTSGLVAVLFSIITFMNIFNATVFLGRKLEKIVVLSALIGFTGIALIFSPELSQTHMADEVVLGIWITLSAAFVASLGNTLAASRHAKNISIIATNMWGMFYGTVFLTIFVSLKGLPMIFDYSPTYIGSLIYLTLFGTIIAFTCYLLLIARIGPERSGYFAVMFPIVALIISTYLESYVWTPQAIIGLLLTVMGNVLILWRRQQKRIA